MRKAEAFVLIFLLIIPQILMAQNEGEDSSPWDYYEDLYIRGDQTFIISLGTIFPIVFFNDGSRVKDTKFTPSLGGTGSLTYNFYFNSHIFTGAEVGGMFIHTLAENTLFVIPVGARLGYQFNIWKLEFPVNGTFGVVWYRFLNLGNFSIYLKASGAAFYRVSSNWSFGLTTSWYWMPQWSKEKDKTVYGNIMDLTLCARYHF